MFYKPIVFVLFFLSFSLRALESSPPELFSHSAVLYDFNSGFLLYEKNADEIIPHRAL